MLRQSSSPPIHGRLNLSTANASVANSNENRGGYLKPKNRRQGKMTTDVLYCAKLTNPYRVCHIIFHWADAHNPDGSLKHGTLCIDP